MLPTALRELPPGVEAALALVAGFDDALMAGFSRLGPRQKEALGALARALGGSPLGPVVAEAISGLKAGPPGDASLVALAAGREAQLGAVHDALLAAAFTALGRTPPVEVPATEPMTAAEASQNLLGSARQWLVELALGGLLQADPGSVGPFLPTLEQLQEDAGLVRTTALLTGFYDELMDLLPLATPDQAPAGRWADLWSRSLLGCTGRGDQPTWTAEKGSFSVFSVELRHHAHLASAVLWGLWEPVGGAARVGRATLSGWRVPAIAGDETWHALLAGRGALLGAVAEKRSWDCEAKVGSTGDLQLGKGAAGKPCDPLEVASRMTSLPLPTLAGADRHPVQIAVPVHFTSKPSKTGVSLGDGEVPLRWDRLSPLQGIDAAALAGCDRWTGLLRWDGGAWSVQPLYGLNSAGKKAVEVGPLEVLAREVKSKSEALGVLKERASKLLRQKS